MDLRRRLIGSLCLLLGSLMAIAVMIQLHSLRGDVASEIGASTRLVSILLAAENAPVRNRSALADRLSGAGIRHLTIRTPEQSPISPKTHPLLDWLGYTNEVQDEQEIRIGNQTLYIAANPNSEIEERLGDTVRILITLLLFSGATLLLAWWSAHRALSPVRELEAGLERLADGDADPALPAFRLHEFRRVAGAIEALAAALKASRAARRDLAHQLIRVQEEERRTLARELHDEMGQTLTALNVTAAHLERHAGQLSPLEVAACAGELRRDLRQGGSQLRQMLKSLRPHGLDAGGLGGALRELVDGWQARSTGIHFHLHLPGELPALSDEAALALYRVVQEALTNVVRHSGARFCAVGLVAVDGEIRAEIVDDGCGLPDSVRPGRGGLLGMAERLEMVGGRWQASNEKTGGLRLCAVLPLAVPG